MSTLLVCTGKVMNDQLGFTPTFPSAPAWSRSSTAPLGGTLSNHRAPPPYTRGASASYQTHFNPAQSAQQAPIYHPAPYPPRSPHHRYHLHSRVTASQAPHVIMAPAFQRQMSPPSTRCPRCQVSLRLGEIVIKPLQQPCNCCCFLGADDGAYTGKLPMPFLSLLP